VILLDLYCQPRGGHGGLKGDQEQFETGRDKVIMVSSTPPGAESFWPGLPSWARIIFLLRPVDVVVLEKRIRQLLQSPVEAPPGSFPSSSCRISCTAYFERIGHTSPLQGLPLI